MLGRLRDSRPAPWEKEPPDFALFETILRLAKAEAGSWEGRLVFVYLPGVWSVENKEAVDPIRMRVLEMVASLQLPLVDVEAAMTTHPDPVSLYSYRGSSLIGPPHFNAEGYEIASEVILEWLSRDSALLGEETRG